MNHMLDSIGAGVLYRIIGLTELIKEVKRVCVCTFKRQCWPRTTREVFAKQLLFTGIDAVPLILLIAALAGVSVVAQAQVWLTRLGQSDMLGPLLVIVLLREFGPLLVNFVVIGRSGTAIATELANMKVNGEIDTLESQGVNPLTYLVMPRVLGMMLSVFCLTVFFVFVSVTVGYLAAMFFQVSAIGPIEFFTGFLKSLVPGDLLNLVAKTMIPGLISGIIACSDGLSISGSVNDVPRAATGAVVRSISALIIVTALIAVVTYAR